MIYGKALWRSGAFCPDPQSPAQGKAGRKKDILSYQGISINKKTREASSSGRVCELTLKEFELLCYLLENQARVVTRDEL